MNKPLYYRVFVILYPILYYATMLGLAFTFSALMACFLPALRPVGSKSTGTKERLAAVVTLALLETPGEPEELEKRVVPETLEVLVPLASLVSLVRPESLEVSEPLGILVKMVLLAKLEPPEVLEELANMDE